MIKDENFVFGDREMIEEKVRTWAALAEIVGTVAVMDQLFLRSTTVIR